MRLERVQIDDLAETFPEDFIESVIYPEALSVVNEAKLDLNVAMSPYFDSHAKAQVLHKYYEILSKGRIINRVSPEALDRRRSFNFTELLANRKFRTLLYHEAWITYKFLQLMIANLDIHATNPARAASVHQMCEAKMREEERHMRELGGAI